jgi:hypothetical protein
VPKHKQSDVAHYKLASQFSLFLKRLFGPSALFPETEKKQRKVKKREEKRGSHSLSISVRTKHYLSSF